MNIRPTPISDRIVSKFRKGEATSDGLILTMEKLERELAEAREETIRTREFMDYGFAKAQEELATVTAQRDRLIKAVEPLEYWRDISECDCSSPLPQGGCLRCDLNRVLKTTNPNEP